MESDNKADAYMDEPASVHERAAVASKHQRKIKTWQGETPPACDLCGARTENEFIDGATHIGLWAFMCPACFSRNGVGLGTGRGQRYKRESESAPFAKVEG